MSISSRCRNSHYHLQLTGDKANIVFDSILASKGKMGWKSKASLLANFVTFTTLEFLPFMYVRFLLIMHDDV